MRVAARARTLTLTDPALAQRPLDARKSAFEPRDGVLEARHRAEQTFERRRLALGGFGDVVDGFHILLAGAALELVTLSRAAEQGVEPVFDREQAIRERLEAGAQLAAPYVACELRIGGLAREAISGGGVGDTGRVRALAGDLTGG